jgi:hypothetical protein
MAAHAAAPSWALASASPLAPRRAWAAVRPRGAGAEPALQGRPARRRPVLAGAAHATQAWRGGDVRDQARPRGRSHARAPAGGHTHLASAHLTAQTTTHGAPHTVVAAAAGPSRRAAAATAAAVAGGAAAGRRGGVRAARRDGRVCSGPRRSRRQWRDGALGAAVSRLRARAAAAVRRGRRGAQRGAGAAAGRGAGGERRAAGGRGVA